MSLNRKTVAIIVAVSVAVLPLVVLQAEAWPPLQGRIVASATVTGLHKFDFELQCPTPITGTDKMKVEFGGSKFALIGVSARDCIDNPNYNQLTGATFDTWKGKGFGTLDQGLGPQPGATFVATFIGAGGKTPSPVQELLPASGSPDCIKLQIFDSSGNKVLDIKSSSGGPRCDIVGYITARAD